MLHLRKARTEDCDLVYKWRNDLRIREYFFDSRPLTAAEHERWFLESLMREDRIILLAVDGERAIGVIRFDLAEPESKYAEVDIYVAPEWQGRGLGSQMLILGEEWVKNKTNVIRLVARVKQENEASVKMFALCSFHLAHLVFEKNLDRG